MDRMEPDENTVIEGELVDDTAQQVAAPVDYTEAGVPTFDYVRDRIESRFATSTGASDLADEATLDEKMAERDRAAAEKLEQIRRSMRGE